MKNIINRNNLKKIKRIILREGLILLKFIGVAVIFAIIGITTGYISEHLPQIYAEKIGNWAIIIICFTFVPLYCYPIYLLIRFILWIKEKTKNTNRSERPE